MALFSEFSIVIIGVIAVLITAHYVVIASINIAKHFRLSDEFIGMTVLAIGTSLPEIITHIVGSIKIISNPDAMHDISALVVGTNVGSDIFQQNVLIGLVAVFAVLTVKRKHFFKDVGGLIAASVILLVFSYNGIVSRLEGLILCSAYVCYLYLLHMYGTDDDTEEVPVEGKSGLMINTVILSGGLLIMGFAADKVLDASVEIVETLNISSSFFGVIVLGIASALPELMTVLIACLKRKTGISAGVLIGSNITNPMFALGSGAILSTYTVPGVVIMYDLPVKIFTAILIYMILRKNEVINRTGGIFLIGLYLIYIYLRNIYFPVDY
jgi:cation:H+ antiporter